MRPRLAFQRITQAGAEALFASCNVLVLDARDSAAFQQDPIPGAQHLSTANISAAISTTPKTMPVLIYCYHGHASQEYAQIFSDFGFLEVYSLDGGRAAWAGGASPPSPG